jgi:hypothetical protein
LLLDAVVRLGAPRTDFSGWDDARWTRALRIAEWHRLSPALFCHVRGRGGAPAPVLTALEHAYLANAGRNLFVRASLRRVVAALAEQDVPAVLLKGAALLETVYADPALREMLDLDLLVPADQIDVGNRAIAPLGFRPLSDARGVGIAPGEAEQIGRGGHHDAALVDEDHLLAVELHRHIAIEGEGNGFAMDEMWKRARRVPGEAFLLPAPEDLLLHVCMHFTRNRLGGSHKRRNTGGALAQIADIARIVEREAIDWSSLALSAHGYRLDASVFIALFAARELGVPIPERGLAATQPAGFDPALGRRLVALRVLRDENHLPVRSARWMFLPSREVLSRGWDADRTDTRSLARAYMRRARANAPLVRSALWQPWLMVQDRRLNTEIHALQEQR